MTLFGLTKIKWGFCLKSCGQTWIRHLEVFFCFVLFNAQNIWSQKIRQNERLEFGESEKSYEPLNRLLNYKIENT